MNETSFTRAVDRLIATTEKTLDRFEKEFIEPLGDIGNLEKLIGKPYEEWTEDDKRALYEVDPKMVDKFIFNKEWDQVLKDEADLKGM